MKTTTKTIIKTNQQEIDRKLQELREQESGLNQENLTNVGSSENPNLDSITAEHTEKIEKTASEIANQVQEIPAIIARSYTPSQSFVDVTNRSIQNSVRISREIEATRETISNHHNEIIQSNLEVLRRQAESSFSHRLNRGCNYTFDTVHRVVT